MIERKPPAPPATVRPSKVHTPVQNVPVRHLNPIPLEAPRAVSPPPGFEQWAAHFRSEMRAEMAGMADGLARQVQTSVDSAVDAKLAPFTSQLGNVLLALSNDQKERKSFRESEKEARESMLQLLGIKKLAAETAAYPGESRARRLAPVWGVVGAIAVALIGLIGAMIASQLRGPKP